MKTPAVVNAAIANRRSAGLAAHSGGPP